MQIIRSFGFWFVLSCSVFIGCQEGDPKSANLVPPVASDLSRFRDRGTLSVLVLVGKSGELSVGRVSRKADPIARTTIHRTKQLSAADIPAAARAGHMRIDVHDTGGSLLLTEYVRDPLHDHVEVPAGIDDRGKMDVERKPAFWTAVKGKPSSFLFVIPDVKGARHVTFTRYTPEGRKSKLGSIELDASDAKASRSSSRVRPAEVAVSAFARTLSDLLFAPVYGQTTYDAADAEHETVVENGPSAGRFDLLILGDGYLDTNADRAAFNDHVQRALAELFKLPIYYELRSGINVHTAFLPSTEFGGGDSPTDLKDTPFGAHFGCESIERLVCLSNVGRTLAFQVADDAPGTYGAGGEDAIAVLTNDTRYGGGGGTVLTFSTNAQSVQILSHEFGHTVIDLADEYESEYDALVESSRTKANISGPIGDRDELKWIGLVDPATPIPTEADDGSCSRNNACSPSTLPAGTAGMYEGGGYVACGSFRPTTECQMRCYPGFFCPVCRGAYQDVLGDFVPAVDVYMRDNSLDIGNTLSPTDVEDPPGSGNSVRPWHSVDIRVDAPPYQPTGGAITHENPIAGEMNRVYVTLHNRGTANATGVAIDLHVAEATGGAPPFPGASWTSLGTEASDVPGNEGEATVVFEWNSPIDVPEHTCMLALADTPEDPLAGLVGDLATIVRSQNNVTWKNLHVVSAAAGASGFSGWISGFWRSTFPMVLRVEAGNAPLGTRFVLRLDGNLPLRPLDPESPIQMTLRRPREGVYEFVRRAKKQRWITFQTKLPAADKEPFRVPYRLEVHTPELAEAREIVVSVDQLAYDPERKRVGVPVGGNTYTVQPQSAVAADW